MYARRSVFLPLLIPRARWWAMLQTYQGRLRISTGRWNPRASCLRTWTGPSGRRERGPRNKLYERIFGNRRISLGLCELNIVTEAKTKRHPSHLVEYLTLFCRMPDSGDAEGKYFVRKWYLPEGFGHVLRSLE